MTYYDLRSALEQLEKLNRLDDSLKITIEHPDHEWDGNSVNPQHITFTALSAPLSVTLIGRELIISCC